MVHSIELLLDPAAETAVRAEWTVLSDAGLPSQAGHRHRSNRPHLTLAIAEDIDDAALASVVAAAAAVLPLPVRLGALTCFGHDPYVLVRMVVASVPLLVLQERVQAAVPASAWLLRRMAPGRWTPHVTLGHRLTADQVGRGLQVLDGVGAGDSAEGAASAVGMRHWNGDARVERLLAGEGGPSDRDGRGGRVST